jgi:hypothetical protein
MGCLPKSVSTGTCLLSSCLAVGGFVTIFICFFSPCTAYDLIQTCFPRTVVSGSMFFETQFQQICKELIFLCDWFINLIGIIVD